MEDYARIFEILGQLRKTSLDIFEDDQSGTQSSTVIDLKRLEDREKLIQKMTEFHTGLSVYVKELDCKITTAKTQYDAEINRMGSFLRTKKVAVVEPESAKPIWNGKKILGKVVAPPPGFTHAVPAQPKYAKAQIAENIHLMAIHVPTFAGVIHNGELYYVESADHFAFKIAGMLFHGNIGNIYTNEADPVRIKACKFRSACTNTNCTYYHDPAHNGGSRDTRNYIASSWLYANPHSPFKNRKTARRYGSREYIAIDMNGLADDEVERFNDQTTHDVLCSMVLQRYHGGQK